MRRLLELFLGIVLAAGTGSCRPAPSVVPDGVGVFVPGAAAASFKLRSTDGRQLIFGVGPTSGIPVAGDWDGDGRDTVGYFDPDTGAFHLTDDFGASTPQFSRVLVGWNCAACRPLAGDFGGSGVDGVGLYDATSGLFLLRDRAEVGSVIRSVAFGEVGHPLLPIAGRFTRCHEDQVGLYDPASATFLLRGCGAVDPTRTFSFGPRGGLPVRGRWNGGELDGIGVFEPATGRFLLRFQANAGPADLDLAFFRAPALPIAGRWRFDPR